MLIMLADFGLGFLIGGGLVFLAVLCLVVTAFAGRGGH